MELNSLFVDLTSILFSRATPSMGDQRNSSIYAVSDVESTRSMADSVSGTQNSTKENLSPSKLENSYCSGIDAVKKLRQNYIINKVLWNITYTTHLDSSPLLPMGVWNEIWYIITVPCRQLQKELNHCF